MAESRIGLQTFAKPFYLLTREEAARHGIEPEYLLPLALSPRSVRGPTLADARYIPHVVFACDRPLDALHSTAAAEYIARGMRAEVRVRGTDTFVQGYHQAPRLARSGRDPWYDLRTEIVRRGAWPILVPRRAFKTFTVVHNFARVVANEDFLELRPHSPSLVEPLLAVLNSFLGEFLLRSHAFQYGGGVFNLNPGAFRDVPMPDLRRLTERHLETLADAWRVFASSGGTPTARAKLNQVVADVLSIPDDARAEVTRALADYVRSTGEVVKPHGVSQLELAAIE